MSFVKSAQIYDLMYAWLDYDQESAYVLKIIQNRHPDASSLLDIGCGTGQHIKRLRRFYDVTGLDINSDMIQIASVNCPSASFHVADMLEFSFETRFDVILCLFSSIAYVKSIKNIRIALKKMSEHIKPGGILVIEPFFTPETYWIRHPSARLVETVDTKLAWMSVSERRGRLALLDLHFMMANRNGVETWTELHEIGLFTHEEYEASFKDAGFDVEFDPVGLHGRGMYIGYSKHDAGQTAGEERIVPAGSAR